MTEKVRVFAETCEYFRVASDVVAKREKNQGGEEEEQILARIKVLPGRKISNVRCLAVMPEKKKDVLGTSRLLAGFHVKSFLDGHLEAPFGEVLSSAFCKINKQPTSLDPPCCHASLGFDCQEH